MPDRVIVEIFTLRFFNSTTDIEQHLDIFDAFNLAPTHWAKNERPTSKRKYRKEELLFYGEDIGDYDLVHLYRQSQPTYTAYYSLGSSNFFMPSIFRLSFEKTASLNSDDIQELFKLVTSLSNQLEPLFGYIWLSWDGDNEKYMPEVSIRGTELGRFGPNPVHARTWFGQHLVKLIGRENLSQCGAFIKETSWGGIELDLVQEPWNATLDELAIRQKQVMEHLQKTEIFGDYSNFPIFHPGKKWIHWAS